MIINFQLPPAMGRVANHQTWLPRASRDGASTASLGNLFQCVTTTLCVKNFLLISNLNLPHLSLKPLPLVLSLSTLINSHFPSLQILEGHNEEKAQSLLFSKLKTSPVPSTFLHRRGAPERCSALLSLNSISDVGCLLSPPFVAKKQVHKKWRGCTAAHLQHISTQHFVNR